jgi:hypothetical protein
MYHAESKSFQHCQSPLLLTTAVKLLPTRLAFKRDSSIGRLWPVGLLGRTIGTMVNYNTSFRYLKLCSSATLHISMFIAVISDALKFWISGRQTNKLIYPIALDLLCPPDYQIAVEGILSPCGLLPARRRNRSHPSMEMRAFLKPNALIIEYWLSTSVLHLHWVCTVGEILKSIEGNELKLATYDRTEFETEMGFSIEL